MKDSYNDSWERAEKEKLDMIYDINKRSRSHSRERENFAESEWDRSEVEGPPSNGKIIYWVNHNNNKIVNVFKDEIYKSNVRDRSRQSEMSQIQRERESLMVYQPKVSEKMKKISASEKATFKNHMYSQKDRERKSSTSTIPSLREKFDDTEISIDDFSTSAIPKPVLASPMLKAPSACLTYNTRVCFASFLYSRQSSSNFFLPQIVPWKLRVRKEVFRPNESLGPAACIDLLFAQILIDVFGPCLRMSTQEKRNASNFLSGHGIDSEMPHANVRTAVKRQLIEIARSWPLYFSRLFIVNGSPNYPEVKVLAIHHSGVYLARKDNETLVVSKTIVFEDLQNVVSFVNAKDFVRRCLTKYFYRSHYQDQPRCS